MFVIKKYYNDSHFILKIPKPNYKLMIVMIILFSGVVYKGYRFYLIEQISRWNEENISDYGIAHSSFSLEMPKNPEDMEYLTLGVFEDHTDVIVTFRFVQKENVLPVLPVLPQPLDHPNYKGLINPTPLELFCVDINYTGYSYFCDGFMVPGFEYQDDDPNRFESNADNYFYRSYVFDDISAGEYFIYLCPTPAASSFRIDMVQANIGGYVMYLIPSI